MKEVASMVRGSVDVVTTTEVRGWAYGYGRHDAVLVQAVLNHEILGEAQANIHRPDLAAAGLGDGNSGYAIKLYRPIDPLYLPFVTVKVDGGDAELPRAPMLGFGEFFAALYAAHPAVGRHRSVLGGLWVDRTDAAAVLRGKLDTGQVLPDAAPPIQQLIQSGFAVLGLAHTPSEFSWREALSDRVGDVLEETALLAPLRSILNDHPLVVRADWMAGETPLGQASARSGAPSPAECIEIIIPFNEGVVLDVVRDSHKLPEFTPAGGSRWGNGAVSVVGAEAFLDRYDLAAGEAVIVGPGTIFRLRCGPGNAAVLITCLPARGMPAALAISGEKREKMRESGVRVLA
jgi:hypothetical protein